MDNYVITIARGFGTGGKQIGMKLADELGISRSYISRIEKKVQNKLKKYIIYID